MPLSDDDKVFLDMAWKMYNEQAVQARQHETLRANIATLLVSLSAAIIGLHQFSRVTSDKPFVSPRLVGATLVCLGLLGYVATNKHHERNRFHVARLRAYRKAIDEVLERHHIPKISPIGSAASGAFERNNPFWSKKVRLYRLWNAAFGLIALLGVALTIQSLL